MGKLLKEIIQNAGVTKVIGREDIVAEVLEFDSRKVKPGTLFIAVRGTITDGHQHIEQAISNGAVAIACQVLPEKITNNVTYIVVEDSSRALGMIAANFYNNPSGKLKLVGVTGTNGKTTTVTLLHSLFRSLGYKPGLISTIQNKINDSVTPATHTTPDPIRINSLLAEMVETGCTYCFMEVSSHAIDQDRIAGLKFTGGIFTNITHDHLDYHKTFDAYLAAKKGFFDGLPGEAFSLINKDDKNGKVVVQNTNSKIYTYSVKSIADFKCRIIENQLNGLQLNINGVNCWFRLTGTFNAYNILAVYGTAVLLGMEPSSVLTAMSILEPVTGRFNTYKSSSGITAIVDYAHTPDALENVLSTINAIRKHKESLITVAGAGGNRDATKRPLMARIASIYSDRVILTSDNPRNEEPEAILEDMKKGIDPGNSKKVLTITDRKEAIRTACALAKPGDIILIAGKGHETYQEIKGVKYPFDDSEVVKEILEIP
jgi:UDP-N-acetylmuramoyl-L-alanyl-D-glutamate--2,6-diaminopimelate ligase